MTDSDGHGTDPRSAVILSGGGAKGAYAVGVLRALFTGAAPTVERPLDPAVLTGSSVGAFNAAVLASSPEGGILRCLDRLEQVWRRDIANVPGGCGNGVFRLRGLPIPELDAACLLRPVRSFLEAVEDSLVLGREGFRRSLRFMQSQQPLPSRILAAVDVESFFDPSPMLSLVKEVVHLPALARSSRYLGLVASRWDIGEPKVFTASEIANHFGHEAILASMALPGIFPVVFINDAPYVDGALSMNTPLKPAIGAGADVLHAVYLDPLLADSDVPRAANTLDDVSRSFAILNANRLNNDIRYAASINRGLELLRGDGTLLPGEQRSDLLAALGRASDAVGRGAAQSHRHLVIHRYRPQGDLGSGADILNFSLELIDELIERGYRETVEHDCAEEGCVVPGRAATSTHRRSRQRRSSSDGETPSPPTSSVKLPATGVVAGPLDDGESKFGDEFFGFPAVFGQRPPPGRTRLTGWVRVQFDEPQGDHVRFTFTYLGVGTPATITWGGGQQYDFLGTRCFPMDYLPDLTTRVFNEGRLDLRSGKVDPKSVKIFATFQATTIGRTQRLNRVANAFPYMYPVFPPLPPPPPPPPGWRPPPDLRAFADVAFRYDGEGRIVGFSIHSETIAAVGLFPYYNRVLPPDQRLFPPFAFGPGIDFFFANPDRCLPGTPEQNYLDVTGSPDGTPTDVSVTFHPNIDLVSGPMREVEARPPVPPCAPHGVARAVSAAAGSRLFVIGGLTDDGVSGRVQVFDPKSTAWSPGADMPMPVYGAQGAAVGSKIYVCGGWTAADKDSLTGRVQVLDAESGSWSEGPALPTPVAEGTAAAVDGRLYVISGWCGDGEISAAVQILDPESGEWSGGAPASLPAVAAAAVVVGHRIYVLCGRYSDDAISNRTNIYDTTADAWAVGPDLRQGVIAAVAGRVGDRVFLVGGRETVGGPAVRVVQELDLGRGAWRLGLPQPVPTAGSGGTAVDGTLYVVGGRVMTGEDALPGELTDLIQSFTTVSDWTLCGSRPVFVSTGVLNAAALVVGPRRLAPGARSVIVGDRFTEPGDSREEAEAAIRVLVDGEEAEVLKVQRERIDFVAPEGIDVSDGKVPVEVIKSDSPKQAKPVMVPAAEVSPGLFTYTYGETREPAFLNRGPAVVRNHDGSLNFADQPAVQGSRVTFYATGLGVDPVAGKADVRIGVDFRYKARVVELRPSADYDGVTEVQVEVPDNPKVGHSNNVLVVLKYDGVEANRVVLSVGAEPRRLDPPVPCELGLAFVFGPPGRSLVAFRPVEAEDAEGVDIDMQEDSAFWRHARGDVR